MRILARAVIAAATIYAFSAAANAEPVGNASALIPDAVQAVPQGTKSDLKLRDAIIRNAELATADKGALEVTFLDGSKLTMGANSRLTVDEYVYTGPGGTGKQTVRYTKGLFRFLSGSIPKDQVKIETPTVTIGIRGTIFRTALLDDGSGFVSVDFGPNGEEYDVFLTSKKTGKVITLHSGQKIGFDSLGVFEGITDGTIEGCQ
ncbi:MAG: FecR domain-containing protein [Alphaproteobacteria bacterium]|nr:FecR domain-containing protein [Alphaproteobacteria bacterium]